MAAIALLLAAIGTTAPKDLIFGVVALDPKRGCDAKCVKAGFDESIRRWAASIRKHTPAASTEVAIFTGHGHSSICRDADLAFVRRRPALAK